MECMGVASGCSEQEVGVASGSGWNLWVWLLGVVVRRYIDFLILLIPTPLVSVLFYSWMKTIQQSLLLTSVFFLFISTLSLSLSLSLFLSLSLSLSLSFSLFLFLPSISVLLSLPHTHSPHLFRAPSHHIFHLLSFQFPPIYIFTSFPLYPPSPNRAPSLE